MVFQLGDDPCLCGHTSSRLKVGIELEKLGRVFSSYKRQTGAMVEIFQIKKKDGNRWNSEVHLFLREA